MCEFWLGMATKKFQPDQLNSSGDIALDNKGTFGLERGTIGLERQKIFLHCLFAVAICRGSSFSEAQMNVQSTSECARHE